MPEETNLQKAMNAYGAFSEGDLHRAMADVADDVVWVISGPAELPATGTVTGKEALVQWFATLNQTIEYQRFEPYEFIAQGDKVVALIHIEAVVMETSKHAITDAAHVWTYRDGKLAHFQAFDDTATIAAAHAK
jgi:uncharacterized protein